MSTWGTKILDHLQEKFHVKPTVFYIGLYVYLSNTAFINMIFKLNLINFCDVYHKLYYYKVQSYWETHITINLIYEQYKNIIGLIADIFQ
jgi:hypothetical protein